MQFKIPKKVELKEGAVRTVSVFLLLPRIINNKRYWMTNATVTQRVMRLHYLIPEGYLNGETFLKWVNVKWEVNEA